MLRLVVPTLTLNVIIIIIIIIIVKKLTAFSLFHVAQPWLPPLALGFPVKPSIFTKSGALNVQNVLYMNRLPAVTRNASKLDIFKTRLHA